MGFVIFVLLLALVYLTVIKPDHGAAVWAWVKSLFDKGGPAAPALLALLLLAADGKPGFAQAQCVSMEQIRDSAKQYGAQLVPLTASQLALMVDSYNSSEPKSDEQFDAGYIARAPGVNFVLLMRDGCMAASARLSDAALANILGRDV